MISYIIWDINPEVLPNFEYLRWYGLCWGLGIIAGYYIMERIYMVDNLPKAELEKLTTYVMIGAVVGARFGHVLFYDPTYYFNNPIEILPIKLEPNFQFTGLLGLASHGGIIGALIALFLYKRKFKKNYLWILDRVTIAGASLAGFIRLGNLMNSEILGRPSSLPWAFIFTRIDQIPRHPTQVYEAILYFATSLFLYFIWKSKKYNSNNGFIFGLGITLIFIQRFLIEFLKENQVSFENDLALNMGQILSIPLILIGVSVMALSLRDSKKETSLEA